MTNKPVGRPSAYSHELGEEIAAHIIDGLTLRQIEAIEDMPSFANIRISQIQQAD